MENERENKRVFNPDNGFFPHKLLPRAQKSRVIFQSYSRNLDSNNSEHFFRNITKNVLRPFDQNPNEEIVSYIK